MNGVTMAFVVLPCLGAVATAALLEDWRLAGAAAAGAMALVVILISVQSPVATLALPLVAGAAVGALTAAPHLRLLPSASIWGRMGAALAVAFAASLANLILFVGRP